MPVTTMAPIRIGHVLVCVYFGIDMFNHHSPSHKVLILCFFSLVSSWFLLDFTKMKLFEWYRSVPKISKISVKRYRIADVFPHAIFIYSGALYRKLIMVFLKILPPKTVGGKAVLIGDHIKAAKEGRRIPVWSASRRVRPK
jgi:hypothetical protein